MNIKILILILILGAGLLYAADSILSSFTAKSNGEEIRVEWSSMEESNLLHYELERSNGDDAFKRIATEKAKGNPSHYKYIDDEALAKNQGNDDSPMSKNLYSYRLKIVYQNKKPEYSDKVYVVHEISSINRTWGMIKEMFR